MPQSTTATPVASWIQKTPGVIGGDACIRNTRIAVWMLVEAKRLGFYRRGAAKPLRHCR